MQGFDMQYLKQIELELFKSFISICEKLGLRYYVIGGTLLGSVRHQGFIPWDDDIDVGMPREDYDRFEKEAQKYLPEYYFVQTRNTDPELLNNFMKIRDSRTTFIETSMKNQKINHGVYIDVFPIDYYPEGNVAQKLFEFQNRIIKTRIRSEFSIPDEAKHSSFVETGMNVVAMLLKAVYPTVERALDAQDRLYRSVKRSKYAANLYGAWGKREVVLAEWLKEECELGFEDIVVKAPKEYDKYLTRIYGDYMQLPPEEKQVGHHYATIIDLNNPYTRYRDE